MSGTNREGPLLGVDVLRKAIKADMLGPADDGTEGWLHYYMGDSERAHGITPGTIGRPRGWQMPQELSKWPEVQIPTLLIAVAALDGTAQDQGDGVMRAPWGVEFGAVVRGADDDDTWQQASVYGAALRQYGTKRLLALPGIDVWGVTWNQSGEAYDRLPQVESRALRMASLAFTVTVQGVVRNHPGVEAVPVSPLGDPGAYPAEATVSVTVSKAQG